MSSSDQESEIKVLKAHVKTLWEGGVKTTGLIRGFEVVADAPKWKYGTNSAPAPGEIFLASIGACFTSTFTRCAQDSGIILDGVVTDVRGIIDHELSGKEVLKTIEMELKVHAEGKYEKGLKQCYDKSKEICPLVNALTCEIEFSYFFVKEDG
jgi:uncharacterized OsmC-like protein